ncbi:O-succinylbenzoate synthase [Micrococcales bacterium KH10]|nr:O-succinylbenzoate synthase [Micrococcales bacterium KH10]
MTRQIHCYDIALRTPFRGLTRRDGVIIRGEHGWGEFSPFWDYDDQAAVHWWHSAVEAADHGWPDPVRETIPINVTVPAVEPDRAVQIVTAAAGCATAKVKVAQAGQTLGDEIARLEAVRAALGPAGKIRIDANAAWTLDEALQRLPLLDRAAGGLEYAEQPVASMTDLAQLRRRQNVPIAADESIRRADDPLRVIRAEAADIAVLKVQPLGGVRRSLQIAAQIDIPVVVSSALETSVGLAAGVALAAALPDLPYACGLGTASLLNDDVVTAPLLPVDGMLQVKAALRAAQDVMPSAPAGAALEQRWRKRVAAVAGGIW